MAIWHRESGSRVASRDGLGAVFQHSPIAIKISVPVPYWQDRNAQNAEKGSLLLRRPGNAAIVNKRDPSVEFDALQGLGETVRSHSRCWDVAETHSAVVGLFAHVVILDIDVLRTGVIFGVGSDGYGRLVVSVDEHRALLRVADFGEKQPEPNSLLCCVALPNVLGLAGGSGDSALTLGGP